MNDFDVTARFNFVTQLSERFLDRLLKELYKRRIFPIEYKGEIKKEDDKYSLLLKLSYDLLLGEPTVYLDTNTEGGIGIRGSITGQGLLEIRILPRGTQEGYDYLLPISLNAKFDAIASLSLIKDGDNSFAQISFVDLRDLLLDFDPIHVPTQYAELLRRLLKRALIVSLRGVVKRVPISQVMETAVVSGWAVFEPILRIIDGPEANDLDNITVAFNTWPNRGLGRPGLLHDWVNPEYEFGVGVDQTLLLQFLDRAWQRGQIPTRFNDEGQPGPQGKNLLKGIVFDFQENDLVVTIHAARQTAIGWEPDVRFHASISMKMENGYLSVNVHDVDIEFPWWINIIGFVALNVVWLIVLDLLKNLLGGLLQETLATTLEEFIRTHAIRFAFSGPVPGSSLKLAAQPLRITITANELVASGNITFETV